MSALPKSGHLSPVSPLAGSDPKRTFTTASQSGTGGLLHWRNVFAQHVWFYSVGERFICPGHWGFAQFNYDTSSVPYSTLGIRVACELDQVLEMWARILFQPRSRQRISSRQKGSYIKVAFTS